VRPRWPTIQRRTAVTTNAVNVMMKYQEQLMNLPNVTGVGIGEGEGRTVIKVLVTRKVAASMLRPEEIIPDTLEGIPVKVEEIGVIEAQSHEE
jgi:hypothetical protein